MAWTKNAIMQLKQPFALTLAILKPHVVKSPFALQVILLNYKKLVIFIFILIFIDNFIGRYY